MKFLLSWLKTKFQQMGKLQNNPLPEAGLTLATGVSKFHPTLGQRVTLTVEPLKAHEIIVLDVEGTIVEVAPSNMIQGYYDIKAVFHPPYEGREFVGNWYIISWRN